MSPVLEIRDYTLDYVTRGGTQRVLQVIDLAIAAGEVLGLVGESGSGKTSLAWAIMRHLPANAREAPAGRIRLGDTDLRAASAKALETIRGRRMSMVFQDPSTALNPDPDDRPPGHRGAGPPPRPLAKGGVARGDPGAGACRPAASPKR